MTSECCKLIKYAAQAKVKPRNKGKPKGDRLGKHAKGLAGTSRTSNTSRVFPLAGGFCEDGTQNFTKTRNSRRCSKPLVLVGVREIVEKRQNRESHGHPLILRISATFTQLLTWHGFWPWTENRAHKSTFGPKSANICLLLDSSCYNFLLLIVLYPFSWHIYLF